MNPIKRLVHTGTFRDALCALVAVYIRFVYATSRWEVRNATVPESFWNAGRPFILVFWHGRLLMMPKIWRRGTPIRMLVSHHRDGELIVRAVKGFGVEAIRGSTSRGGTGALRELVRSARDGVYIGLTPDGPRGPRMRASTGIASLSRLAGIPIVPAAYAVARRRLLRSWDRFVVPLPFNRGIFVWGDPIEVHGRDQAELEATRHLIEDRLNQLTAEADIACGVTPIEPATAPATVPDGDHFASA
jgi:lysophospholipid acyltransferase (LPLAT)-like uncharacterized protein